MTLYYSLVFILLVTEMALFMLLIVPLPFTIRRKMFTLMYYLQTCSQTQLMFIRSESPIIAKLQYGMKVTFIFILILFVDSVNRVFRVQLELAESNKQQGRSAIMGHERLEVQARKFYSQRNMYLCGFTLFLSLILNRTYTLILEVLRLEEKVKKYEESKMDDKKNVLPTDVDSIEEVVKLRKVLSEKDRDLEILKKQSEGLSREYSKLSDEISERDIDPVLKKDK
ncbi:Uncharacterized protein C9E9.04 [Golovinomyces cichoracearum]|uniref:Endoplasmic reticulum transmembrane protein n=1 Tax=Golovinomyces cichoracearum TaxID=62708 RepID=A0A420INT6_9PEZI|nr:Uncharacterized protein C9E9.04 [Golovinomyces cichoracearum]